MGKIIINVYVNLFHILREKDRVNWPELKIS